MRKLWKKMLMLTICIAMLTSLAACENNKKTSEKSDSKYGQIWTAPSTVKIDEYDTAYASKGELELNYHAVRNEYESRQIVITAEKDVESFTMTASDLYCGDAILSKENITIYVEKYVLYDDSNGRGYQPDALLPVEVSKQYGENKIPAKRNGALWVTVYIPKDVAQGLYTGTFELCLQGAEGEEKIDVPVRVEVADYTLTDEVHAETLFSWRYNRVAAGELDGSIAMMQCYYEFFKDYRISLQSLPLATLSGEEYVENVLKYYDQISSYTILSKVGAITGDLLYYQDRAKEQILALAAASTTERNLFDKAIIYFIDEPELSDREVRKWVVSSVNELNAMLDECIYTIETDTSGTYDAFKKRKDWKESIENIPDVMPILTSSVEWMLNNENTEEGQELLEALNCICPILGAFNDKLSKNLIELTERNNLELWWYGCVSAIVPEPTYFIGDSNLLSARTLSWLQKKYKVVGNLYWDAAAYTDENKQFLDEYINVYEKPIRKTGTALPAGDGFLAYPGAAYGIYGPLPSMRLMSIRDGMEEYELLYDLEKKLGDLQENFGKDFSVDLALDAYYKQLVSDGMNTYADGENGLQFDKLRSQLIQLITSFDKGLGFVMGNVEIQNATANCSCYAQEGATVSINGEVVKPVNGTKYDFSVNLEERTDAEIVVTNSNGEKLTYKHYIGTPLYVLNALSEKAAIEKIQVTDRSQVEFVQDNKHSTDGTAVHFNMNGVLTGNTLTDAVFVPNASISTSLFENAKLSELSTLSMDVYNPGEAFQMRICIYSGVSFVDLGTYEIESGKNELKLALRNRNFSQMETADRIAFEFANAVDGEALSYEFYIDNIRGEK